MTNPSASWGEADLRALEEALGEGKIHRWDEERLGAYARDESGLPPLAPELVVFAESTEDVQAVMRWASLRRVPVTPCAARTGKSGGSLPLHGGIALSLERMDRILELRPDDLTMVVQPGCVTGAVMAAAEEVGLFYPPDPNSWESCSIGGNVAENAGGPRALKYGVTRDYVLGLEVVLPSGERIRTGRQTIKGVAGYDLTALLVGSEGTLGIVTEITLELLPRPRQIRTALCLFPDTSAASRAVAAILAAGILPRTLEFFDDCAIDASSKLGPYRFPAEARAAILAETDGDDPDGVMGALSTLGEIALERGAVDVLIAHSEAQREELWATRRRVSEALRSLHPLKISEDIVVPRSKIPEAVARIKALGETHGFTVATYGHAGDGNLHANVLFDTEEERQRAEGCVEDLVRIALELGGTITGEHGVGLAKRPFLGWEQGEDVIELQRRIKAVFDPLGILNPGKIFP